MTDEETVRTYWQPDTRVRVNDYREIDLAADRDYEDWEWAAAARFTEEHKAKVAEVRHEIQILATLAAMIASRTAEWDGYKRIHAREQAALGDLLRGVREEWRRR